MRGGMFCAGSAFLSVFGSSSPRMRKSVNRSKCAVFRFLSAAKKGAIIKMAVLYVKMDFAL